MTMTILTTPLTTASARAATAAPIAAAGENRHRNVTVV
jgi:hypothetical protein